MNPMETSSVYWHFPILIVVVSLVNGATRFENWNQILVESFHWGRRMTVFLLTIGIGLYVIPLLGGWGLVWAGVGGALGLIGYMFLTRPRPGHG